MLNKNKYNQIIPSSESGTQEFNTSSFRKAQTQIKVTFSKLEYEVTVRLSRQEAKEKGARSVRQQIVKGVSGCALPGQSLYIMGSSGAGKTSLLNLLSDRISKQSGMTDFRGEILINDKITLNQNVFGSVGAYVMQDDVLYSSFTPREALTFAAKLKLRST